MTADARQVPLDDGDLGKTALMGQIAREIDLPLITLIGSTLDGVLVGGFPIVDAAGNLTRRVMQVLQRACDEPCLLFLDEVSTAPPPVQAAFLTERCAFRRALAEAEAEAEALNNEEKG